MGIGRRRGRILALQALFAWDFGCEITDELLNFSWRQFEASEDCLQADFLFPKMIVLGTIENITEIDEIISSHLNNWTIDRISAVDKAILRLSIYSLLYQKDIPAPIIIDEAVNLAKDFGSDDSYKFINAVLDKVEGKS